MSLEQNNIPPKDEGKARFFRRILRMIGIHFPYGRWYRIYISGRLFILLGGMAVLGMIFLGVMYNYSTRPGFCRTCHIMEPYYRAWATSSHKETATCVTCHYPPTGSALPMKFRAMSQVVKYVTRTYAPKPRAEVEDENCLQKGCHETRLLEGKITMLGGEIHFDHTPHLKQLRRGKQLRCTSCHSQIMIGTHMEVTLSTCYDCHFKGHKPGRFEQPLAGCRKCHVPPSTPLDLGDGLTFNHADYIDLPGVRCIYCHVDSVKGDGLAPKERCFSCHNTPERLVQYGAVDFMHKLHVSDRNIECQACHLAIEHKIHASPLEEGTCNQCHSPSHSAVLDMYRGKWPGLEKLQPSTMTRTGVHCIACHSYSSHTDPGKSFAPITWEANARACENCHGEGFGDFIGEWKTDLRELLDRIDKKVHRLEARVDSAPEDDQQLPALKLLLWRAQVDTSFTKLGHGVHNYDLASARLLELERALEEVLTEPAEP